MLRGGCDGGRVDGGGGRGVSLPLASLVLLASPLGCGGSVEQLVAQVL
jgi:hypothetical protein